MPKFVPLPLPKRDLPADAQAAAAITQTVKTIALVAPSMKTKIACVQFWQALAIYANRNVAELQGAVAKPAAAAKSAVAEKPAKKQAAPPPKRAARAAKPTTPPQTMTASA